MLQEHDNAILNDKVTIKAKIQNKVDKAFIFCEYSQRNYSFTSFSRTSQLGDDSTACTLHSSTSHSFSRFISYTFLNFEQLSTQ